MPEKKTAPGCEFMFVHQEIVERVNAAMPAEETLFDLAELFKIFGDSTRIKILYFFTAPQEEAIERLAAVTA